MKINFIKKGLMLLALGVLSIGCTDNDPDNIFGANADERIGARKAELRSALLSSTEGWKTTYFTDDTELGGFSFIFKFENETEVRMVSDYNDATLTPLDVPSEYNVVLGSTVALLFDTPNYLHYLSDNSNYPTAAFKGRGYLGDFIFLYHGTEGDDVINFKSNRSHVDIKFERATKQDWDQLRLNRTMMDVVATKKTLITLEGDESMTYNFKYTKATRYASVLSADKQYSVNANGGIGVGFTPSSIKISPAIEFEDGSSISELTLDGNRFMGEVNGNVVILQ